MKLFVKTGIVTIIAALSLPLLNWLWDISTSETEPFSVLYFFQYFINLISLFGYYIIIKYEPLKNRNIIYLTVINILLFSLILLPIMKEVSLSILPSIMSSFILWIILVLKINDLLSLVAMVGVFIPLHFVNLMISVYFIFQSNVEILLLVISPLLYLFHYLTILMLSKTIKIAFK